MAWACVTRMAPRSSLELLDGTMPVLEACWGCVHWLWSDWLIESGYAHWAVAPLELYTMESMVIFLSLTECYTILMPIHHSGLKRSSPIHVHIFHITYLNVQRFMLWLKQDDQSHHYLCHYVQVCSSWKGYAYVLWHQSNRFEKIQELEWSQRCKQMLVKLTKQVYSYPIQISTGTWCNILLHKWSRFLLVIVVFWKLCR